MMLFPFFCPEAEVCQRMEYDGGGTQDNTQPTSYGFLLFSFKKWPTTRPQKTNSHCRSGHLHGPWRSTYLPAQKGHQLTNPTAWTESWLRGVQCSSHTHPPPKSSHVTRTSSMLLFQGYHSSGIWFWHNAVIANFWNKGVRGWLSLAWCQCWRVCWQHSTRF